MPLSACRFTRAGIAYVLVSILAVCHSLPAQTHVVNPAELQRMAVAAARAHQHKVEIVTEFLSSAKAQKALRSARIDPTQVKTAVSALCDEELAQLASRVETAQVDFAAGRLTERDLLIVLLGIAALILIIVAVR